MKDRLEVEIDRIKDFIGTNTELLTAYEQAKKIMSTTIELLKGKVLFDFLSEYFYQNYKK